MKKRILRVFLALTVFILLLSLPVRADALLRSVLTEVIPVDVYV